MLDLVRKRYNGPGWIVLGEVANSTGAIASRFADAIAYGVWPSNGHVLHGFEFKISRSDLMNEIKDPSKSDGVGKYCDFWWLVVSDAKIIETVEIPATWGVLEAKGRALRKIKDAPQRDAVPMSRGFIASLMRRALEQGDVAKVDEIRTLREGQSAAIDKHVSGMAERNSNLIDELAKERAKNARYERAAGVWNMDQEKVLAWMAKIHDVSLVIGEAERRLANVRHHASLLNESVKGIEYATGEAKTLSVLFGMLGEKT